MYGKDPDELVGELIAKRDIIPASVLITLCKVEQDLAADGWDQPPRLLAMRRALAPPEVLQGQGELLLLSVHQVGAGEALGRNGAAIAWKLNRLAERAPTAPADIREDSESIVAWVLVTEAYAASSADPDDDRLPSEMPDRVEVRMVNCSDIAGANFLLMRRRDTDQVTAELFEPGGQGYLRGPLFEALRAVTDAFA